MIERYTRPEMKKLWSDENKFRIWLDIEIAACEAQAELGAIPAEAVEGIRKKANFNVQRIHEIEAETNHDVIAFLTNLAEFVGEEARYIHYGMTSSDVLDTALAIQMKQAGETIHQDLQRLLEVIKKQAIRYKDTISIGRTHGIHAEPITFGFKLAVWYEETKRNLQRWQRALEVISVGQISGAVGTYEHISPRVEELVCKKLGLRPAPISTQIIQRDRHAEYVTTLAIIAGSLEKFATEIRHLQKTEVLEVEEPFKAGQKGSSAMPHKRNPIVCERICGLARLIRGNAQAALENISLWHERDISHSAVERIIIPDSTILMNYALHLMVQVLANLRVDGDRMRENIFITHGVIFSQPVLLALIKKGMPREVAYQLIQTKAMDCWNQKKDFKTELLNDPEITTRLNRTEIDNCFQFDQVLSNVDFIFRRMGLINS